MRAFLDPAVFMTVILLLISLKSKSRHLKIIVALMTFVTFLPISEILVFNLENKYETPVNLPQVEAAVVFGGGFLGFNQKTNQYEYGSSFDRFAEALRLVREHKIKYLVFTGVTPDLKPDYLSEADSVYKLAQEWGLNSEQIILDHKAINTSENGQATKKILSDLGISEFLLVTSASHMNRACGVLKRLGLKPYAYPVDHQVGQEDLGKLKNFGINKWVLLKTYLHEVVGLIYYKVRGYV